MVYIKDTKQMEWRDLSGPEKIRLFKNIDIPIKVFSNTSKCICHSNFGVYLGELEKSDVEPNELQVDIKNWVAMLLRVN